MVVNTIIEKSPILKSNTNCLAISSKGADHDITLPKAPAAINADAMTVEQLHAELLAGYADMKEENTQDASTAFARFRQTHR